MEISSITPIQVISNYTNINNAGNNEIITNFKHINKDGSIRIEAVDYIRYNKNGQLVRVTPHATTDIII